jgi:hypothetical protein
VTDVQRADSAWSLPSAIRALPFVVGGIAFFVLATANGAGYRYGASDQAFYIPAVARALDPALFPRDGPIIDAEGRLMVIDEILAALARTTGLTLPILFFGGYLVSVALLWSAVWLIGTRLYRTPWAVAALAAAITLRHRIPRTSANSFEPYFHPRMLAFGCGTLAVAALLRRRAWLAIGLVAIGALLHVTTALWFAVLVGVSLAVLDRRWRQWAAPAIVAVAILLSAMAVVGPLRGTLATMDDIWLQAVASKDSLFATEWPIWAWLANLGFLGLLWWAHRRRVRTGTSSAEDGALAWGATALVALFLLTLPFVAGKLALAVQLQISRVFWLVDLVAVVYLVAVAVESHPRHAALVAILLIVASAARGAYIMFVEVPERTLFAVREPASAWEDAMRWVAAQPRGIHLLADPGHAWKYGTSVRVAATRDVLVEEVKDSAVAIYSRTAAMRFVDRTIAIGDYTALTASRARELASRYDLDYVVTESDLPLPLAYRNERFRIYSLR